MTTTPPVKPAPAVKPLRTFLEIPYDKMEELNLAAKAQRLDRVDPEKLKKERIKYLESEKDIKAVTVCFTDLEGRLHMLDYDKKFLLKSYDNLTFDGSSVRGFLLSRAISAACGRPSVSSSTANNCALMPSALSAHCCMTSGAAPAPSATSALCAGSCSFVSGLRNCSTLSKMIRLMSSRSTTTSITQSH